MHEILEILEKDARTEPGEIARMLNMTPRAVANAVKKFEKDGVILKYKTVINKEAIRDEDSGVRETAASALVTIGTSTVAPLLVIVALPASMV